MKLIESRYETSRKKAPFLERVSLTWGRWQVLSGSWLKVIAMACMMIDHTASRLFRHAEAFNEPLISLGNHHMTWNYLMWSIGRLAFPLFAFLLVEGFQHTSNRKKYGRNLFVFALISVIPWILTHGGHWYSVFGNVFFTLFFGFLALCAVSQWETERQQNASEAFLSKSNTRLAIQVFACIVAPILLCCDFGSSGVSFILLLYVLRHNRILQAATGCCYLSSRWIAGLAFIPINLYNGRRGFIKGPIAKYLFYAFYPVHLLVLYVFMRLLGIA